MKVLLLIWRRATRRSSCARHGTRGTSGAARTRRSAVSGGRPRARGGSGSCAARRRPRGRRPPASRRGPARSEAFGGKRPSRPPTRWMWTSTGISGMPQVKISTQAAVLRPTPGRSSRNSSDSSRGAVSVQSRSGGSPSRSRIAWIRGAFCFAEAAGPDRLLDLLDRRVADLLPGREALAQRREGAVAVAVVGVLGEDGLDQLGDRVPVRLVDRPPVHLAQPVADRPHPPLVRAASTPSPGPYVCGRSHGIWSARGGARSKRTELTVDGVQGLLPAGRRARGRRPSTATATRPTARTGCRSWSAAGPRSRSTCRAGGAPTARTRPASTTRCTGSRPFSSAASRSSGSAGASSSSTTGAAWR